MKLRITEAVLAEAYRLAAEDENTAGGVRQ